MYQNCLIIGIWILIFENFVWDNFKFQDLDPPRGSFGASATALKPWSNSSISFEKVRGYIQIRGPAQRPLPPPM